ncbi:MAG: DUF3641 domain-containing protein [Pyrinomonadaceae bacterium]
MKGEKFLKIFGGAVALGTFGALVWLENRRPLRRSVESKLVRTSRNLAVAGIAAVALQLAERPFVEPLTKLVERKNLGLLKLIRLPRRLETVLAVENDLPQMIAGFNPEKFANRKIITGAHCFGCTAGAGSSCGGTVT